MPLCSTSPRTRGEVEQAARALPPPTSEPYAMAPAVIGGRSAPSALFLPGAFGPRRGRPGSGAPRPAGLPLALCSDLGRPRRRPVLELDHQHAHLLVPA